MRRIELGWLDFYLILQIAMNPFRPPLLLLLGLLPIATAEPTKARFQIDPALPPADWVLEPARVETPEESIGKFDLAPGFRAEVVAAEPLVQDPIALTFGPDGRIWVIEYPGYNWEYRVRLGMSEEPAPGGRVVVLEDTNGDGRMDKRTVFLDGIENARAISLVGDGVLIGQPPELWFYRDTTGDGMADDKQRILSDYGPLTTSHAQPSGLMRAMDNWIYSTRFTSRMRWKDGEWQRDQPVASRGQWGISQDNSGRFFYNTQSDPLRADLVPPAYWRRNADLPIPAGINERVAHDLTGVKAHHATPGVNERWNGFLDDAGKLVHFTSACAPTVYRGQQFPDELAGDVFVAVPAGNLLRHYRLKHGDDGLIEAENVYDDREFLFSYDERFRPVHTSVGPDGALYLVDMYRGVIEGETWITDITHDYILKRKLHEPHNGLGRIYRIVHEDRPLGEAADLAKATPVQLAGHLRHPNGWWRDTAQQLLLDHGADESAVRALHALALDRTENFYVRLHAMWTLEGLGSLTEEAATSGFSDPDPHVRSASLRLAEPWIGGPGVLTAMADLVDDPHNGVRRQLLYTLGESEDAEAEAAMLILLHKHGGEPWMNEAALSGLQNRELRFLETLIADPAWQDPPAGAEALAGLLAQAVVNRGEGAELTKLIEILRGETGWWRAAALAGAGNGRTVSLAKFPALLLSLLELPDPQLREQATALVAAIKVESVETGVDLTKLEESVRVLYERGRDRHLVCAACHQSDLKGFAGVAPPLLGSPWLDHHPDGMIHIVLNGYNDHEGFPSMAPLPGLDDKSIASILTYLRLTHGENSSPVDEESVKRVREASGGRTEPWTREELEKLR